MNLTKIKIEKEDGNIKICPEPKFFTSVITEIPEITYFTSHYFYNSVPDKFPKQKLQEIFC